MKKLQIFIFALFLFSSTLFAQNAKNEATIKEVNALELKRFDAQVKKDYAALMLILSDELVYIHSSGKVDNKESYIQSIKDGKSVYDAIDSEEMKTRIFHENTAIINGVCKIKLGGASPSEVQLRYTDVYIKNKSNVWQMVSWQSGKITPPSK